MRPLLVGLLLASTLAGCASPGATTAPPADGPAPPAATPAPDAEGAPLVAQAPRHPVGRAWTYEGEELYNEDARFTVVVAEATPSGYLFAGGAEDDLVYHALWRSPWYGERAPDLDGEADWNVLDFPLSDGKTWAQTEDLRVSASVEEIDTPSGRETGFRIEGATERWRVSYDYSPAIGQIVRWETGRLDGPRFESVRMVAVADAQPWVWFERGDLVVAGNPHEPGAFEVPEGFDAVIVSAGGRGGSSAVVAPPGGDAWRAEFDGDEAWRHAILPATPGRWEAAVAGWPYVEGAPALPVDAPIGWAYAHLAPVRWVRGG